MFRKTLGGALVAITVVIGLVGVNRRWIFGFIGLTFGTFLLFFGVAMGTAIVAIAAWEWGKGNSAGD